MFFGFLLFGIPLMALIALVFWISSLYRYLYAKKQNKQVPETFSLDEVKKRKSALTLASEIFATLFIVAIGVYMLLGLAISNM